MFDEKKDVGEMHQPQMPDYNRNLSAPSDGPKTKVKTSGKISSAGIAAIVVLVLLVASGAWASYYYFIAPPKADLPAAVDEVMGTPKEDKAMEDELATTTPTSTDETMEENMLDVSKIQDLNNFKIALEKFFDDNGKYPLPPIGGADLKENTKCLDSVGFKGSEQDCQTEGYYGVKFEDFIFDFDYKYYLCSNDVYIIELGQEGLEDNIYITPIGDGQLADICLDLDKDGLPNFLESFYGSNPILRDTDDDTYLDGAEVLSGYNPNGPGQLEQEVIAQPESTPETDEPEPVDSSQEPEPAPESTTEDGGDSTYYSPPPVYGGLPGYVPPSDDSSDEQPQTDPGTEEDVPPEEVPPPEDLQ